VFVQRFESLSEPVFIIEFEVSGISVPVRFRSAAGERPFECYFCLNIFHQHGLLPLFCWRWVE